MSGLFERMKHNRTLLIMIMAGGMVLILMGLTLSSDNKARTELKQTHASMMDELKQVERQVAEKQADEDKLKAEVVYETTGLDPALVEKDKLVANDFFGKAFNWKNGKEYDGVREYYIKELGADNSFTKTYLPPDTKIDTNDGELSYIDFKKLKAYMEEKDMEIVPLLAENNRIRYVAFVRYYMHTDSQDLNNLKALEPSEAIIKFTVSGNDGERSVSEVDVWAGFASSDEVN